MKHRVLIVEDGANHRERMSKRLQSIGCDVTTAANENDARESLLQRFYSAVVTDLNLEDAQGSRFGGIDVVKAAKSQEPERPVIVVSNYLRGLLSQDLDRYDNVIYLNRTSDYLELLPKFLKSALGAWDRSLKRRLTIIVPDQTGEPLRYHVEPGDPISRPTRKPYSLDVNLFKRGRLFDLPRSV